LYLLALPMYVILGWDMRLIIVITGFSVVIYSVLGGIKAVIWTDAIQAIILIAGAVVSLAFLIFSLPGGLEQYIETAVRHNKFSLGDFGLSLTESTFWVVFIYGIFINLQNYGIDQNYIQRYMTARSDKEAKRSALYGGLLYIPVSMLFLFIGTALYVFYSTSAAQLPVVLIDANKSVHVFQFFCCHQ